ncbi:hypothetical protein B0A49_06463 [Cryomyces minteri]|uniref:NB-ARC domain-containing protein n=1 Tax=Cryomyces minteri TaxID=331657 RepID=A0A4U0X6T8_9PEZI|nr:hypothetical protein B0A49_06463 [Cryomyces minteri]
MAKNYETLAGIAGFEILLLSTKREFLEENWRSKSLQERGEAFKYWLEESKEPKIVIVDDADALGDGDAAHDLLPLKAENLIISTRNPFILPASQSKQLLIPTMKPDEVTQLMKAGLRDGCFVSNDPVSMAGLKTIRGVLGYHPLAVQHAIETMNKSLAFNTTQLPVESFLESFASSDHDFRLKFIEEKWLRNRPSILDCFRTSVQRLHSDDPHLFSLWNFAGFWSPVADSGDFCQFFFKIIPKNWSLLLDKREQLPDFEFFGLANTPNGRFVLGKYIQKLVEVSLFTAPSNGALKEIRIHKLWIECIRQLAGQEGRLRCIR